VKLAKTAVDGKKILIAGCNPPAEDCYQSDRKISFLELKKNHKSHINSLKKNGVDFILNETQSHFDEIKIICDECFGFPFVISLFLTEDLKLLSGEKASNVIEYLLAYMPVGKLIAVGVNCINQKTFKRFLKEVQPDFPWGFYLNCGAGDYTDKNITCNISPSKYIKIIEPASKYNPLFIGSCCGSTPNHTASIRKYVDELYRN